MYKDKNVPNGLCNRFEAIRETEMDIDEGADIVVKPGLCYPDIVREIKNEVMFLLQYIKFLVSMPCLKLLPKKVG